MKSKPHTAVGGVKRLHFQVLVYREADLWLAHCLDLDVVAQASTPQTAVEGMINAVDALFSDAIQEEGSIDHILTERRAPEELWNRLKAVQWKQRLKHKAGFLVKGAQPQIARSAAEAPTMELEAGLELCTS